MAERRSIAETSRLFIQQVGDDDLPGMAGEVAYNLLLALFPGLIFVAALAGFVGGALGVDNLFTQVLDALRQFMPPAALEMVTEPIRQVLSTQSGGLLSIGAIGALWAASNATAVDEGL
jgi:membrane protein